MINKPSESLVQELVIALKNTEPYRHMLISNGGQHPSREAKLKWYNRHNHIDGLVDMINMQMGSPNKKFARRLRNSRHGAVELVVQMEYENRKNAK